MKKFMMTTLTLTLLGLSNLSSAQETRTTIKMICAKGEVCDYFKISEGNKALYTSIALSDSHGEWKMGSTNDEDAAQMDRNIEKKLGIKYINFKSLSKHIQIYLSRYAPNLPYTLVLNLNNFNNERASLSVNTKLEPFDKFNLSFNSEDLSDPTKLGFKRTELSLKLKKLVEMYNMQYPLDVRTTTIEDITRGTSHEGNH